MVEAAPSFGDVAHLAHVELLTPCPDDSLRFFTEILGMEETARSGQSVYLRGWGQYEQYCLKLSEAKQPGIGHIAFRAASEQALERRAKAIADGGLGIGWTEGDIGHGKTYVFTDPDGHQFEIYYETEKYKAPAHLQPALKNQPQRFTGKGAAVRKLDHVNLLAQQVAPNSRYIEQTLGLKVSEQILLDDGTYGGSWLYSGQKAYELVYTADAKQAKGRLHHLAFCVDSREEVMRTADLFMEHHLTIEGGPAKHAIQQTIFLYTFEPGGNRIEICTGGYMIFDPDYEPIIWTQAERAKGQAWSTPTIPSFHTYGTPVIED